MVSIKWAGIIPVLTVILAVLCLAAPAMAATWEVNPDGTGDFTTIQAALDSEWTSGDMIEIAYAVYKEPVAVDADGSALTITGIPSPAGELPVIDGMNSTEWMDDAPELSCFDNCMNSSGVCSMYLYDGNFIVSNLLVTNASMHGLLVYSNTDGHTVQITGVEAAENERHGIYIIGYDKAVLTEITASDNGRDGIKTEYTNTEGTDLCCLRNAHEGLKIKDSDLAKIAFVKSAENGRRGITVCLNGSSTAIISDILVTDNGRDGLFVKGKSSEFSTADISRVESTGNCYAGVFLNGFDTFSARELLLDGNGVEQDLPPNPDCMNTTIENEEECLGRSSPNVACDNATITSPLSRSLRKEGTGLFVVKCGEGLIDNVEAMNNTAVGILVDTTGDVVIANSTADANGYQGILTVVSDEYPPCAELISNISDDDTKIPQQPGADGSIPVPTTTPAGLAPVIGALGLLGALAVIRRR